MSEKVRVNVFYGGFSSERSVSLETGRNVGNALKKLGYPVKFVDVNRDFPDSPYGLDCDVAFIALHGEFGEDGGIQDVLESADVPFTGSSAAASRLALNKVQAQRLFSFNGIPVPPSHSARGREEVMALVRKVQGYPVIVKPAREGSTYGISVVRRCEQLRSALERALEFDELVLVEKFIEGREFTVGLVGSRALPVLEVIPSKEIFDFAAKYKDEASYSFEHGLSQELENRLMEYSLRAADIVNCEGISRADLMVSNDGEVYFLEINTVPGMTSHSLVPMAAAKVGIPFERLCEIAVELALSG